MKIILAILKFFAKFGGKYGTRVTKASMVPSLKGTNVISSTVKKIDMRHLAASKPKKGSWLQALANRYRGSKGLWNAFTDGITLKEMSELIGGSENDTQDMVNSTRSSDDPLVSKSSGFKKYVDVGKRALKYLGRDTEVTKILSEIRTEAGSSDERNLKFEDYDVEMFSSLSVSQKDRILNHYLARISMLIACSSEDSEQYHLINSAVGTLLEGKIPQPMSRVAESVVTSNVSKVRMEYDAISKSMLTAMVGIMRQFKEATLSDFFDMHTSILSDTPIKGIVGDATFPLCSKLAAVIPNGGSLTIPEIYSAMSVLNELDLEEGDAKDDVYTATQFLVESATSNNLAVDIYNDRDGGGNYGY